MALFRGHLEGVCLWLFRGKFRLKVARSACDVRAQCKDSPTEGSAKQVGGWWQAGQPTHTFLHISTIEFFFVCVASSILGSVIWHPPTASPSPLRYQRMLYFGCIFFCCAYSGPLLSTIAAFASCDPFCGV